MENKKDIVYVDMDDTLCDFNSAFISALHYNPSIRFPQSQLKFFENLDPIIGAIEGYHKLKKDYDVRILTAPSVRNPLCYMEKRLWVEKHLGYDECNNLILAQDKTALRGRYLVDDFMQYGAFKPEWEHIVFGSKLYPNWTAVLNYLQSRE